MKNDGATGASGSGGTQGGGGTGAGGAETGGTGVRSPRPASGTAPGGSGGTVTHPAFAGNDGSSGGGGGGRPRDEGPYLNDPPQAALPGLEDTRLIPGTATVPPDEPLSDGQLGVLDLMATAGTPWSRGCGWNWVSDDTTMKILDELTKRGYVSVSWPHNYIPVYELTVLGRAMAVRAQPPAEVTPLPDLGVMWLEFNSMISRQKRLIHEALTEMEAEIGRARAMMAPGATEMARVMIHIPVVRLSSLVADFTRHASALDALRKASAYLPEARRD